MKPPQFDQYGNGKSFNLWLLLIALGTLAFFIDPNSTGIDFLRSFFGVAGSANTYRAKKDDDRDLEIKRIEAQNGTAKPPGPTAPGNNPPVVQ